MDTFIKIKGFSKCFDTIGEAADFLTSQEGIDTAEVDTIDIKCGLVGSDTLSRNECSGDFVYRAWYLCILKRGESFADPYSDVDILQEYNAEAEAVKSQEAYKALAAGYKIRADLVETTTSESIGTVKEGTEHSADIKDIIQKTGWKMSEFSDYLGIPYRTVQNWVRGVRKCPTYIAALIWRKLVEDGVL